MRLAFLWLITGASLVVALVAWRQARRTAKRLEQLAEAMKEAALAVDNRTLNL